MHLLTAKKCIKIYQIILMYIFRYNCDVEMSNTYEDDLNLDGSTSSNKNRRGRFSKN